MQAQTHLHTVHHFACVYVHRGHYIHKLLTRTELTWLTFSWVMIIDRAYIHVRGDREETGAQFIRCFYTVDQPRM